MPPGGIISGLKFMAHQQLWNIKQEELITMKQIKLMDALLYKERPEMASKRTRVTRFLRYWVPFYTY